MSKIATGPRAMLKAGSWAAILIAQPNMLLAQANSNAAAIGTVVATDATTGKADEIIVTGTRIARPDLTTASPVSVIGADEIRFRLPTTAEDLLRNLPSVRPSLGPAVDNGGNGTSSVDLRGLGVNRTLVLLDGRRLVPSGLNAQVDLDVIPTALLERVDVVTGGASSVYGADAVAGVVNFITRKDFTGVDARTSYRITQRGDAPTYTADVTFGTNFAGGRGNVVLSAGYAERHSLAVSNRKIGAVPLSSTTGQYLGSATTVPTLILSPNLSTIGLGNIGLGWVIDPASGAFRTTQVADTYNANAGVFFQTPLTRKNVYGSAHYALTPDIEIYGTGFYSRNRSNLQLGSSGSFLLSYALPLSNAYLPAAARSQLCAANGIGAAACGAAAATTSRTDPAYREVTVVAGRRFVENGPRVDPTVFSVYQIDGGIRGNVTDGIRFDVSGQYGRTTSTLTRQNWGSYSKLQQALRSYTNAAGQPVCYDASNGCVAFNLFGPQGTITPAMLGFIAESGVIRSMTSQTVVDAGISGDLFGIRSPLADKPVAFSLGSEYRRMAARNLPDTVSATAGELLGTGAPATPDHGSFDVKEVFGELIAPLVSDRPWLYRLQAEGGVRYSSYSTTGGSVTWKAGGEAAPVKGFKVRAMYQLAVRSPNLSELYTTQTTGLGSLATDPCQASLPVANAGLAALCRATGAPASTIGSIPVPSSSLINVTSGGNPSLEPEKARTLTLGGVFEPGFARNVSLTIDWWHIKIRNTISSVSTGDVINGCYSAALNPTYAFNAFCALIHRNPATGGLNGGGDTLGVLASTANLGTTATAGIDLGVNYSLPLERVGLPARAGALSFGFLGTWLDYYYSQTIPNAINRDCTGYYSTNCLNPRPRWKWNLRSTYSVGALDVSLLWTHLGAVTIEPYLATPLTPLSTPQPGGPAPSTVLTAFQRIKAYDYFDLSVAARPAKQMSITLAVDNLFDRQPPNVGSSVGGATYNYGNTFPTVYDVLGRTFMLAVELKF